MFVAIPRTLDRKHITLFDFSFLFTKWSDESLLYQK